MKTPEPRGSVSAGLLSLLSGQPGANPAAQEHLQELVTAQLRLVGDIIEDEDLQLALFCLYELHYGGLDGVDDRWEWNPDLIRLRHLLEAPFEQSLRSAAHECATLASLPRAETLSSDDVADILFDLAARDSGPSMSRHVARKATLEQLHEFLIHKSMYQLKEADPHTWAIPRLTGRAKAALVEIQADEYGGGGCRQHHRADAHRGDRIPDLVSE